MATINELEKEIKRLTALYESLPKAEDKELHRFTIGNTIVFIDSVHKTRQVKNDIEFGDVLKIYPKEISTKLIDDESVSSVVKISKVNPFTI